MANNTLYQFQLNEDEFDTLLRVLKTANDIISDININQNYTTQLQTVINKIHQTKKKIK